MFSRMLKLPEEVRTRYDLSSLEVAIHAAAPCPAQVKEQMIEWWGPIIHEYYGATEGLGFTACDTAEWLAHRGTVGRVLFGVLHGVKAFASSGAPLGDLAKSYLGSGMSDALNLAAVISSFGAGMGCASVGARMLYALGRVVERILQKQAMAYWPLAAAIGIVLFAVLGSALQTLPFAEFLNLSQRVMVCGKLGAKSERRSERAVMADSCPGTEETTRFPFTGS